jgi:hypothetical protein
LFVGAETGAAVHGQHAFDFGVRPRDHMNTDQFANSTRGGSAGIGGRFHGANVSTHEHGHITRADVFFAKQLHVGGFDHRVSRFDGADETFRFDHSECFKGHLRQSSLFKIVEVKKQNRLRLKLPPRGLRIKTVKQELRKV